MAALMVPNTKGSVPVVWRFHALLRRPILYPALKADPPDDSVLAYAPEADVTVSAVPLLGAAIVMLPAAPIAILSALFV